MAGENFSLRESQLVPISLIADPNGLLNGGGGGGGGTEQLVRDYYRAINSGLGYSEGDILTSLMRYTIATTAHLATRWFNLTTQLFINTPLTIDIIPLDSFRLPLTSETITVSNVAIGLTTIPALANRAEIQLHDANIVFTYDGVTVPSASPDIGITVQQGNLIILQSRAEVLNFNTIRQTASDARIYVQYLQSYCG